MISIHSVNIRGRDLNLLSVFVGIGEELNLTRASRRLGLSQPALSHALARLRHEFGDPLFVRGQRGMIATPRAEGLLPKIRSLLEGVASLYSTGSFDLASLERTAVIASTDYFEVRRIEPFLTTVMQAAPRLRIETRSLSGEFPEAELESGAIDIAIAAYFGDPPPRFSSRVIFREGFACIGAGTHRYFKGRATAKKYLAAEHLQIDVPPGSTFAVDHTLAALGTPRVLRLRIGNFLTPPDILATNELLLTCPVSLAKYYAQKNPGLRVGRLPFALPEVETRMVWHRKNERDLFHIWLRETLAPSNTR